MAAKKDSKNSKPGLFGWGISSLLDSAEINSNEEGKNIEATVLFCGESANIPQVANEIFQDKKLNWQTKKFFEKKQEIGFFIDEKQYIWVICGKDPTELAKNSHDSSFQKSGFATFRDLSCKLINEFENKDLKNISIKFAGTSKEEKLGALAGLDLGAYKYKSKNSKAKESPVKLNFCSEDLDQGLLEEAKSIAKGVNIARHLVNTPANELNPKTYAEEIKKLFKSMDCVEVEIWDKSRLAEENMGLLLGVGKGAKHDPRFVQLRYRPKNGSKAKPYAFVGKGITFDSGGLDIKPSASMRLMKKDMGGSATLVGLAHWVATSDYPLPCDFYLPLAENAVSHNSMRPGDILTSRNGTTVEIHNTDAEGRLVLADAIDVAASKEGKDEPEYIIDVATLTGAVKVGLGTEIGGLFSNSDLLSENLLKASHKWGDHLWRMPLYENYGKSLKSSAADILNCGTTRFGGAISAALFLMRFIKGKPWAHIDLMAWAEDGGFSNEAGGNGQGVMALMGFLESVND